MKKHLTQFLIQVSIQPLTLLSLTDYECISVTNESLQIISYLGPKQFSNVTSEDESLETKNSKIFLMPLICLRQEGFGVREKIKVNPLLKKKGLLSLLQTSPCPAAATQAELGTLGNGKSFAAQGHLFTIPRVPTLDFLLDN